MGLSSLHTAAPEPLQVVPVSQLNALLFGLLEPLVVAMKAQTAATAALSEKVTQLMTNQAALDAQDAILAADVNTLTTVTQNVVWRPGEAGWRDPKQTDDERRERERRQRKSHA